MHPSLKNCAISGTVFIVCAKNRTDGANYGRSLLRSEIRVLRGESVFFTEEAQPSGVGGGGHAQQLRRLFAQQPLAFAGAELELIQSQQKFFTSF